MRIKQGPQALVRNPMVVAAVVLKLVLASKIVRAEGAAEGLGRVDSSDVAVKSRVIVEACAALTFICLVPLRGCRGRGRFGIWRGRQRSACVLGPQVDLVSHRFSGCVKEEKKSHPLDLAPSKGVESTGACSCAAVPPSISPDEA